MMGAHVPPFFPLVLILNLILNLNPALRAIEAGVPFGSREGFAKGPGPYDSDGLKVPLRCEPLAVRGLRLRLRIKSKINFGMTAQTLSAWLPAFAVLGLSVALPATEKPHTVTRGCSAAVRLSARMRLSFDRSDTASFVFGPRRRRAARLTESRSSIREPLPPFTGAFGAER